MQLFATQSALSSASEEHGKEGSEALGEETHRPVKMRAIAQVGIGIARDAVHAMKINVTVPAEKIKTLVNEGFVAIEGTVGVATEDWLNAERDLLRSCESELIEQDGKFEIRMNAPGFGPSGVKVTASPDALIVTASSSHTHKKNEGNVRFWEFGQKSLFRRFDLSEPINLDNVTADLNKGVLYLTAAKANREKAPKPKAKEPGRLSCGSKAGIEDILLVGGKNDERNDRAANDCQCDQDRERRRQEDLCLRAGAQRLLSRTRPVFRVSSPSNYRMECSLKAIATHQERPAQ